MNGNVRNKVLIQRLGLSTLLLAAALGITYLPARTTADARWTRQALAFDANMRATDIALRGHTAAAQQPALGFGFRITRPEAVETWAYAVGGHCFERNHGLGLECVDIPLTRMSEAQSRARGTVWARFDTTHRLREITAWSKARDSVAAAHVLHRLAESLNGRAGPPHAKQHDAAAAWWSPGAPRHQVIEYRFSDYYAKLSATSLGRDGFLMVQQYRNLQ